MALVLYYHPLSSFCQKVLIALHELSVTYEACIVNLADETSSAALRAAWPLAKIPVLRDMTCNQTFPETSIIIEYMTQAYAHSCGLIPGNPEQALSVRLWDRVFDLHVNVPMGKVVTDRLRPQGGYDLYGVEEAKRTLAVAYDIIEQQIATRTWATGEEFTLADCAAAPALFYAQTVMPFGDKHSNTAAYLDRLMSRPSVARTLDEARPYFKYYPLREQLPERCRAA